MLSGVKLSEGQSHAVEASLLTIVATSLDGSVSVGFKAREIREKARYWVLGTSRSLLPHLRSHPQQLSHRPGRQTLHLIMQLGHRFKKSRHRRQPLPGKIHTRFFRI